MSALENMNETEPAAQHQLHDLTTGEYVLWIILYGVVAFLAVAGNLLVIYVVTTSPRLQNVTSCFIVNLSIADALTGLLAIPFKFQAALLQKWPLPNFMCSLVPFIETVTLSVSVFTLVGTAVDRFQTVVLKSQNKMTKQSARTIIFAIWGFSVACSVPYGWDHRVLERIFTYNETIEGFTTERNGSVFVCWPQNGDEMWWKVYNVYLTIIQYFVPLFIINGAYCIIAYKVWLTEPMVDIRDERGVSFQRNKKKVVKMLLMVVAVFTFCWLPYETYLVLNEVRENINEVYATVRLANEQAMYYYINVIFFCCHWLAMSNSCLNPIIYAVYNEKFQREYKRVFCACCGKMPESQSDNRFDSVVDSQERNTMLNLNDSQNVNNCHYYIASELGKDDD